MIREEAERHNTTLGDIAARAGVSKTAVSRVLNGRQIRIGPEKREEILALAASLHYRPNIIARSLQGRTTRTVGVVVPDLTTLFYPELVHRIETRLATEGYQTIICNSKDKPLHERQQLDNLLARFVDGLILVPAAGGANLTFLRDIHLRRVPLLMLDRYYPDEAFHYVAADNRGGAAAGTAWLLKQGVTRVLYLGEERRNQALEERVAGVREAIIGSTAQFPADDFFLCSPERAAVSKACQALLDKRGPGAGVFLESHRLLMGLLDACRERHLRIPDDLVTVGFDPFEPCLLTAGDLASLRVLTSPPTTILQNTQAMADEACQFLLSCFGQGQHQGDATWRKLLKPELIAGGMPLASTPHHKPRSTMSYNHQD